MRDAIYSNPAISFLDMKNTLTDFWKLFLTALYVLESKPSPLLFLYHKQIKTFKLLEII